MLRNPITYLIFGWALLLMTACGNPITTAMDYNVTKGKLMFWTPEPLWIEDLPDGDDSYCQGFRDGCNTAVGIIGSGLLRMHPFAYDINRGIEDRDYYRGQRTGYNYCTYYVDSEPL